MANITVGGMPNTTSLAKTDLIHVVQSGVDKNSAIQPLTDVLGTTTGAVAQAVTDGDTITSLVMDLSITSDASSADVDFGLGTPSLLGGVITVSSSGSNLTSFSGTGLYANKIFVSDGLTATVRIVSDGSGGLKYSADSGVAADYVSGIYTIKQNSLGEMELSINNYTVATSGAGGFTLTPPTPFIDKYYTHSINGLTASGVSPGIFSILAASSAGAILCISNVLGSTARNVSATFKGKY